MSIKLSLCIPTYNRATFLDETLRSIVDQATENVEIVISDNASEDDTESVVERYQKIFPRIFYHRQPQNMGIDYNLLKVVELAHGEYCWLFSSDDVMKPGAISKILNVIQSEYEIYLCGFTDCSLDMRVRGDFFISRIDTESVFNLSDKEERLRYFRMAEKTPAFFSFCSSLIVSKSRWDTTILSESFDGTLWAHAARLFGMIPEGLRVQYLPVSLLYKRGDNDSFNTSGLAKRHLMTIDGYYRIADTFFGPESEEAFHIRRVTRNELRLRALLKSKLECQEKGCQDDLKLLNRLVEKHYHDPSWINSIKRLLYNITPLIIVKAGRFMLKTFQSQQRKWQKAVNLSL